VRQRFWFWLPLSHSAASSVRVCRSSAREFESGG
jgi:cob(I)alamin adenosyltransferase